MRFTVGETHLRFRSDLLAYNNTHTPSSTLAHALPILCLCHASKFLCASTYPPLRSIRQNIYGTLPCISLDFGNYDRRDENA